MSIADASSALIVSLRTYSRLVDPLAGHNRIIPTAYSQIQMMHRKPEETVGEMTTGQPSMMKDLPVLFFQSQHDLEAWLEENHATSRGIWLKLARKNSGVSSVSRADALDAALCFGWIDGQAATLDDRFWLQRFTPRRPKSKWSLINCKKVTELAAQGRMRPAGLKEIEAAKRDGRWERAYASPKNMTIPDDLQKRLDANPNARAFFESLDSRNRYAILYRIHDAKKEETRARRIEQFVAMLNDQKTIY